MPSEQHPFAIDFNVMLYGKCGKIERGGVKSNRYTKEFGRVPGSSDLQQPQSTEWPAPTALH